MRTRRLAPASALAAFLASAAVAQQAPVMLGVDSEQVVDGVAVGCTGVGQSKNDPRWLAYPLRIEFADPRREYLADGVLQVADASGKPLVTLSCDGPWFLIKAPPGTWRLEGWLPRQPTVPRQRATVRTPTSGQTRFVLEFPDP